MFDKPVIIKHLNANMRDTIRKSTWKLIRWNEVLWGQLLQPCDLFGFCFIHFFSLVCWCLYSFLGGAFGLFDNIKILVKPMIVYSRWVQRLSWLTSPSFLIFSELSQYMDCVHLLRHNRQLFVLKWALLTSKPLFRSEHKSEPSENFSNSSISKIVIISWKDLSPSTLFCTP